MIESYTYFEIKSQTQAWQNAHDLTWNAAPSIKAMTNRYDQVLFTGCGSTYYLSLAGAALFQKMTGKGARAVPGSELLFNSGSVVDRRYRCLLIAISRSGTTSETVKAVEHFKNAGMGEVIAVTNYDSTLANLADLSIIIPAGQEMSVAQTRSFASMYMAVTALCAIAADRPDVREAMENLPLLGQSLMEKFEPVAVEIGKNLDLDRFYFLGSGARYGLACEVSLKLKEMALTHSEPFYFHEFRHGPMSMVGPTTMVVGLLSDENFAQERKVLDEMREMGARIFALSESHGDVVFNSGIPEEVRGVLYLPVLQLMAFHRSLAKGLNPDSPTHLTAVVTLEL